MQRFEQLEHLEGLGFTKKALEPYFAGLTGSDGHIEGDRNRNVVATSDKEFMDRVLSPVVKGQGYANSVFWDDAAGVYKISIYSKELSERLTRKYRIPPGKKASTIKPPDGLYGEQKLWNVRGWFDGEGWPEEMRKYFREAEYHYPRVGFKVKSVTVRDWVASYLQDEGIRITTYDRKDGSCGLWINGYEECRKFDNLVGFRHPKQNKKLKELLGREKRGLSARGAG